MVEVLARLLYQELLELLILETAEVVAALAVVELAAQELLL
jgi:hypothetical protein